MKPTQLWIFGAVFSMSLLLFLDTVVRGGTSPVMSPTATPIPTFNPKNTRRNPFIVVQAQRTPAPKRAHAGGNIALTGVFAQAGSTPLATFTVNGVDMVVGEGDQLKPTPVRVVKIRSTTVTLSDGETMNWQPAAPVGVPMIQTLSTTPPQTSTPPIPQHTPMPGADPQPTPLSLTGAQHA